MLNDDEEIVLWCRNKQQNKKILNSYGTKSNIPGEGPTESNFPQETESFFEKKDSVDKGSYFP